jgi:hypothetical protein
MKIGAEEVCPLFCNCEALNCCPSASSASCELASKNMLSAMRCASVADDAELVKRNGAGRRYVASP